MKSNCCRLLCILLFGYLTTNVGISQEVTTLTLINADNDTDIRTLKLSDTIDLGTLNSGINIRADVTGTVGSVKFGVNSNSNVRTEGAAPYAIGGDDAGNYRQWTPGVGLNVITATPYTEGGGSGTVGTALTINLFVKNSGGVGEPGAIYPLPDKPGTGAVTVSGQLKKWHKITLSFDGPAYKETATGPNPFLDYRLNVTFKNGKKSYVVPGYFAADGMSAETSSDSGNVWRVHFSPDEEGDWTFTASFCLEGHIAVNNNITAGKKVSPIDGATGTIKISASDKTGKDNRAKGRLRYVGGHYLKYAETNELFIKGGADAPENFLAYEDFDNTPNKGGYLKSWNPHAVDYKPGDPSWQGGKGTEIIGAINYLASEGLNTFSFLTMNINGDDKNVYPYVSSTNYYSFDCSKLDQWEIVFEHADSLGMYLHFKTQETENELLLDNGNVGPQRKLYYRELVARFSHHLALNWNLGEENGHFPANEGGNQNTTQRREMAKYFHDTDPYNHNIVLHTAPNKQNEIYPSLTGLSSELTGASIQIGWNKVYAETGKWVDASAAAGKRWVVANDEQGSADIGVPEDAFTGTPDKHDIRKQTLWGNLMAGGAGVEYYFGYKRPESDLTCQNFRSRDESWDFVRFALEFFKTKELEEMSANNSLVSSGWCLANQGLSYIIYLQNGGTATLTLSDTATYAVKWYNPRLGGDLADGSITTIKGAGAKSLGYPPSDSTLDWAAYVTRDFGTNKLPTASFKADSVTGFAPVKVSFDGSASTDSDGIIASYYWDFGDEITGSGVNVEHTFSKPGIFKVTLKVTDNDGGFSSETQYINIAKENVSSECGTQFEILSRDFPYVGTKFYLDSYTGTDLLAITPTPPNPATASVTTSFTGETCTYKVIFHGVGENDGQSEFKVSVGGNLLGTFVVPLSTESWAIGEAYNFTWEGIKINNGDEITVEGKTASADVEWSRARWLKIEFVPFDCKNTRFIEEDGLLVIEAETIELAPGWEVKTDFPDPTGGSYIQYTGANSLGSPNLASEIEYIIQIKTPGTYQFNWRSRNGPGAVKADEENDSWMKIEADDFYGMKDGKKTSLKGDFIKVWIQTLTAWTYGSKGEHHGVNGMSVFATFNNPGEYKIKVAGRSHGHPIDRIVLYLPAKSGEALNSNTAASEGGCGVNSSKDFASKKTQNARRVEKSFTIDGKADEQWEYAEAGSGAFEVRGIELPTESDLSYTYKTAYDDENFYFLAEVKDDVLKTYEGTAGNYEAFDNVELYFNPDGKHMENGVYGTDAIQIRLNYGIKNNKISGNGTWKASDYVGLEYATNVINGGYSIEAQIPWKGILPTGMKITQEMTMGFEVQANDKDNSGSIESRVSWANNTLKDAADSDTRKFGELFLEKKKYNYVVKTGWEVIYVDSEETLGSRDNAIDGDINTFWHTEWKDNKPALPHEIQIDFKEILDVAEVHYLHRQDNWGPNGAIGKYEIYLGNSSTDWGEPVTVGELTWPADIKNDYKSVHRIQLNEMSSGRFLRLVALTEAQNNPAIPFTAIAELDILKPIKVSSLEQKNSDQEKWVKVFPNTIREGKIIVSLLENLKVRVKLYDAKGSMIVNTEKFESRFILPLNNLNSGIYFIEVSAEGKPSFHEKIIVIE